MNRTERAQRWRAGGFTLLETVLSLAIISVLLTAMGSLVVFSARAMTVEARAGGGKGNAALERLASDLALATSVVSATATAIEFKVPDRDGDGAEETLKYEVEGLPKGSLTWMCNGAAKAVLASNLSEFAFEFWTASESESTPSVTTTHPEAYVGGWNSGLLYFAQGVSSGKSVAQNFVPTLPAGTTSWKITRVRFLAKTDGLANGETKVQLRTTGSTRAPRGTVLASASVLESTLPVGYGMVEVAFPNCPTLAPDEEVAIVFEWVSDTSSMALGSATLAVIRSAAMWSYNGSWSSSPLNVIPHEVYATRTSASSVSASAERLQRVGASMRIGSGSAVRTTAHLINMPGVM